MVSKTGCFGGQALIREVARHARVSIGTVSRVIHSHPSVNPVLQARVQKAIEELGYRPNLLARGLRERRSRSLGLIIPDVTNPFFAEVVKALERQASKVGYTVILGNSEESPDAERLYIEIFMGRMVDGLIVVPSLETKQLDVAAECPIVLMDRSLPGHALVASDHSGGARSAVEHLLELGHRRIACIAGPRETAVASERYEGYCQAMKAAKLTWGAKTTEHGTFDYDAGYKGATALLKRDPRPTAIFASSDQQAVGAMRAAADNGLGVPQELSVVGFDDIPLGALLTPRLTTVRQSFDALSELAVSQLLLQKSGELSPKERRLPTNLICRRVMRAGGVRARQRRRRRSMGLSRQQSPTSLS